MFLLHLKRIFLFIFEIGDMPIRLLHYNYFIINGNGSIHNRYDDNVMNIACNMTTRESETNSFHVTANIIRRKLRIYRRKRTLLCRKRHKRSRNFLP